MKITSEQKLASPTEEILDIQIVFNPKNPEEEGLAALVATVADLVKNFQRLNTLAGDDNGS